MASTAALGTGHSALVFAPGSIGNVGPGFDVLGLAVDGIGDTVALELIDGDDVPVVVSGRDAALVPTDPARNVVNIAAHAMLRRLGRDGGVAVRIDKQLPVAGGLGGSAASSVAGAYAAALACGVAEPAALDVIEAALAGETFASGRHLDNIAPITLGGLALSRGSDPIDVIKLPIGADWWVALVTPQVRVETKAARAILPPQSPRGEWIQQMANTAAMVHAFAAGDGALLRRSLDDRYAEPRRASLIPHFHDVKRAALDAGAFGCSISGSGPTVFAIATEAAAHDCTSAMQRAFGAIGSTAHVAPIAREGVRRA
jgi:homoserine kinase